MTVPVPSSLTFIYLEDGITTVFSYPVRFLEATELLVIREAADGVRTTLVYNSDYTVSGAGNANGGSITRTAVTNGGKIIIGRRTASKQLVDLKDAQRNPAEAVELQMDRLTMAIQDNGERIGSIEVKTDAIDQAVINAANSAAAAALSEANAAEDAASAAASAVNAASYDPTFREATVPALLASTRAAGGEGTIWQAGATVYGEAPAGSARADLTTAAGVKVNVLRGQMITPLSFGCKGDGSDDTTQMISALDSGEDLYFPRGTVFGVEGQIDLNQAAGQRLYGRGALKARQAMDRLLVVDQDFIKINELEFDGGGLVKEALIYGVGAGSTGTVGDIDIDNVYLHDLDAGANTFSQGAAGILIFKASGVVRVQNSRFLNMLSDTNGIVGDGVGVCRAVMVRTPDNAIVPGVSIERNYIDNVRGDDGDGIFVSGTNSDLNTTIAHNWIRNCDHRAIKTQGRRVDALYNRYDHPGTAAAQGVACIDLQLGKDCQAVGNTIDATYFYGGVKVAGDGAVIRGNRVRGGTAAIGGNTTIGLWIDGGIGARVSENVVYDFQQIMRLGSAGSAHVTGNHWQVDNGSARSRGVTILGTDLGGHIISDNTAAGSIGAAALIEWAGKESLFHDNFTYFAGSNYATVTMISGMGSGNVFSRNVSNASGQATIRKDSGLSAIPAGTLTDQNRNIAAVESTGNGLGNVRTAVGGILHTAPLYDGLPDVWGTISGGQYLWNSSGFRQKAGAPSSASDGTAL